MRFIELESVKHRLQVGVPLPFSVRQSDHTLLLARGQVLVSLEQLQALFSRGMLVDLAELETTAHRVLKAPPEQLPRLWEESIDSATRALCALPKKNLDVVIDDVAAPLMALVERDPDLAIFQVLRQHGGRHAQYGANHSIHCAIAAFLTVQRLSWNKPDVQRAFKAALTMNVSMLELQGELAAQATPLTPAQREAIHSHPQRSMHMLALAGITDPEWLQAVAEHHETSSGSGYPSGLRDVTPLAAVLHQCDVYTARLSPRQSREALGADQVARSLFADHPRDPTTAALIKEFGLYPPGCFVKLASGETGIVVRRGPSAHTPEVATVTTARGAALSEPLRRDTRQPEFGVVALLGERAGPVVIAPARLMALVCA
ncbi:MAG: HD domain-containing phosphohydrolase [Burkholderiales bacterium]